MGILSNNKDGTYKIRTKDDLILESWPDYAIKRVNEQTKKQWEEENNIEIEDNNIKSKKKTISIHNNEKNINHKENMVRKSFCNENYLTTMKSGIAITEEKNQLSCEKNIKEKLKEKSYEEYSNGR